MNEIAARQNEIIESFELLDGDLEMSNIYLIELGEKLPAYPEEARDEEHLVKGCQSKVWLHSNLENGKVLLKGDSNTAITKGLLSLLITVLNGLKPDQIIDADLDFIERIGLKRFIGTQRSNGFGAMIKQIKLDALVYKAKIS